MPTTIADKLKTVPREPGAYLMKDAKGAIVYVGKARVLKDRLTQHFSPSNVAGPWHDVMISKTVDFDYIVTRSELESFILEANLIKEHEPRYNIRLADDKSYPYLKMTDEMYPRLIVLRDLRKGARVTVPGTRGETVRGLHDPKRKEIHSLKGHVFGPYPQASSMWDTLHLVSQVFKLRVCNRQLDGSPNGKPCLMLYINRCTAPCTGAIPAAEYAAQVEQALLFLEGKSEAVIKRLREEMQAAAEALEFERAAKLRDRLKAIERATEDQVMVTNQAREQDVLAAVVEGDRALVQLLVVRAGKLIEQKQFAFAHTLGRPAASVLEAFLTTHYSSEHATIPREILVSHEIEDMGTWAELLQEVRGAKVEVVRPQRGERRRLVELAERNAKLALERVVQTAAERQRVSMTALRDLADALSLAERPRRIECFDISTTQGKESTGSMVVFSDGHADKRFYRRFRMRATEGKPDDYAMMKEMLTRRLGAALAGSEKFLPLPDLIIVDGGKGQLGVAEEALAEAGLQIALASLAKREEEVFVPGRSEPLDMEQHMHARFLLQRLRDEAHRFAITHHRSVRDKAMTRSILDDAPGIGDRRKKELLKAFGSVQEMAKASLEELSRVQGMNKEVALALWKYLNERQ
jgi:excinuclease ABC subunit C